MAKDTPIRLPSSSDRIVIVGRTGSGKSQAGSWHLSMQAFDTMPWVVLDSKDDPDEIFNRVAMAQQITYKELPSKPGIYILKILPGESEELEGWLWRAWQRGDIGIFVDEGTMIDKYSKSFNSMLNQGRSKRIPMIILTQQPVNVSGYVFSEAGFWQVFDLTRMSDRKKVEENTNIPRDYNLPDYHSYYYDVGKKNLVTFAPVPDAEVILRNIDAKHPKKRRYL
jgi:hypothetical protein